LIMGGKLTCEMTDKEVFVSRAAANVMYRLATHHDEEIGSCRNWNARECKIALLTNL